MIRITCNATDGDLIAVHPVPVAALYDEQGVAEPAAAAGNVRTLKEMRCDAGFRLQPRGRNRNRPHGR